MTEAEKNEIVGLVMNQISSQAVDFDIETEQPQANDLLTAVRQTSSGAYVGVTIKWDDVARIATEVANRAAERAEQAETDANNILERVQSEGTEIVNFVATSKAALETQKNESVNAVKSVYQTDLDELKGDLSAEQRARESADNTFRADLTANANADAVTRRSLDALWKLNQGISYQFESDDSVAYSKTVPTGAKLASVQNIGGKTEVIDSALVSADVRALNVIGKNVFPGNVSKIINYGGGYNGFEIGGLIPSAVYTVSVSNTDYVRKYGKIIYKDNIGTFIGHPSNDSESIKAGAPKNVIATDRGTISICLNITKYTSVEDFMTQARAIWQDLQIEIGENATGYSPYHSKTIPLPDAVCALPGYGWSVGEVCNAIERTDDSWQYVQRVGSREYQEGDTVTDGVTTYYVMDIPVVTDITDLMTDFQAYFEVEAGGTITMENAAMLPVPSTEKYIIALKEVNG